MMKIAFAVAIAAAVLTPAPSLVGATPAQAQTLRMAQGVDVQIGRDRSDRYDRDRRRDDATVGIGPDGVRSRRAGSGTIDFSCFTIHNCNWSQSRAQGHSCSPAVSSSNPALSERPMIPECQPHDRRRRGFTRSP